MLQENKDKRVEYIKIVEYLVPALLEAEADINYPNINGYTPIHMAARNVSNIP